MIGAISLIIGAGLIISTFIFDTNSKFLAWGGGLIGMGISCMIIEIKLRDKDYTIEVSSKEERTVMLREKAGQITNGILFVLLSILTIVLTVIKAETWIIITVACLAALQIVLFHLFYRLLSKKY